MFVMTGKSRRCQNNHCVVALVFDSVEPFDYVVCVLPLVCVCFGSYVVNDLLYYLFAEFAQFWFAWVD